MKNKPDETKQPAQPGIACRDCGCRHFYTIYTRHKPGYILRMKQCRYCGRRIHTREVANGHGCAARNHWVMLPCIAATNGSLVAECCFLMGSLFTEDELKYFQKYLDKLHLLHSKYNNVKS